MARPPKPRRWLGVLVVLLVAAAVGAGWYWKTRGAPETLYQTATAARGDLTQTVTATGQLNPVINVQVGSQISGTIQKLFTDYNSNVVAGQLVAQIDPSIYEAVVHQSEADLANAKAALELAQVNARRSKELVDSKLIPQSDYDTTLAALHQAEAMVQLKQASLQRAKVDLDHCRIYSPVSGSVISRSVDVGQTVAASLSAPTLFVIANDLAKMQIDANVAEADIGGVTIGQDVEFTVDAFPNRTFHGKVSEVRNAPITVQNVVSYDTVISVSNPDLKLRPGMTANVSIIINRKDNVLTIPNAALRFRPPETASATNRTGAAAAPASSNGAAHARSKTGRPKTRTVYVLARPDQPPQPVQIKPGISDGTETEVLEGLQAGAVVVTAILTPAGGAARPTSPFGGPRFR